MKNALAKMELLSTVEKNADAGVNTFVTSEQSMWGVNMTSVHT